MTSTPHHPAATVGVVAHAHPVHAGRPGVRVAGLGRPGPDRTVPVGGPGPDAERVATLAGHYGAEVLTAWP